MLPLLLLPLALTIPSDARAIASLLADTNRDNASWDRGTAIAQIAWPVVGATVVWALW